MKITFLGGAREVTGSMHLVEAAGKRILLDCGLFEGRRREAAERNRDLPFDPSGIDCLVLSHAHIDHSGKIPTLARRGFGGSIYATHATRDLCNILLQDCAHILADDAAYLNRKRERKHLPPIEPLYSKRDAERSLRQFVTLGYHRPIDINPGVRLTFLDAGHLLGSAIAVLEVREGGETKRVAFTGDLGREKMLLLRTREPAGACDCLVMESTYGDRLHGPQEGAEATLADTVNRTVSRGGRIIIPAFSVGRTQQIVHALDRLIGRGSVPEVPVYVDSPLSVSATEIFRLHPECYNDSTYNYIMGDPNPFGFESCHYIRKTSDSVKLNSVSESCVIISSSGMCEAGRILHHLKNGVEDPRNTVLIANFCAEHTLGKRIVEKKLRVNIFGEVYSLKAEVVTIDAFSAHADRDELLSYVEESDGAIRRFAIVHGEESQALSLAGAVRERTGREVTVPRRGESIEV